MASWDIEGVIDDLVTDIQDTLWGMVEGLADFSADLLAAIPVPEFLATLPSMVSQVPADVLYWVEPFQIPYGFTVITAAITARMLLSLVPFVGQAFR